MDNQASIPTESQQYQQYYQHYQQPNQQPEVTNPSACVPSTQPYYASYPHYNQAPHQQPEAQPGYSSYYYPDYSNSYQSQPQADPSSIHPPGVTIPAETLQTLVENHPDVYYSHGFVNLQQQQPHNGYTAPSYSTFTARGGHGDRPNRGGRHSSFRGRGKGRGKGGARGTTSVSYLAPGIPSHVPPPSSSVPGQASLAPPRMAWCDLCKVDCNTPEVLELHKNGKKHKKNLKVSEELQTVSKVQVHLQNPQISGVVSGNNIGGVDIAESSGAQTLEQREQIGVARGGLKRKVKGGNGGKLMKCNDGSRKPVQPGKLKKGVDLFCSLCSVKCESQVVYNSHMVGKKHLSNVKKFQGHQPTMGSGVGVLYTSIPNVPSTLQALYPPTPTVQSTPSTTQGNQQGPIEANKALASTALDNIQQGDVQDPQAKLVQILNQHGIQDAQSLLSQMIPVLLTQVLPNGATPNVTGLVVTQNHQNSVAHVPSGESESKSKMAVGESVLRIEPSEGGAESHNIRSLELQEEVIVPPTMTATTSTEQASVDGRENEVIAG